MTDLTQTIARIIDPEAGWDEPAARPTGKTVRGRPVYECACPDNLLNGPIVRALAKARQIIPLIEAELQADPPDLQSIGVPLSLAETGIREECARTIETFPIEKMDKPRQDESITHWLRRNLAAAIRAGKGES